jgi:YVTN family beta-propeller protein
MRTSPAPMRRGALPFLLVALATVSSVATAQSLDKAYIVGAGGTVTAIDTATETVVATIAAGAGAVSVAISPDGRRAYVSNRDADSVSVVDTATDTTVSTIPVGDAPGALTVAPDGRTVYVVLAAGLVQAIDSAAGNVVATIAVSGSGGGIAITPDGTRAYVASGVVSVIAMSPNSVTASLTLSAGSATAVAISRDGARAYFLANGINPFGGGAGVVALDTATNSEAGTIVLGALPGHLALAPDGGRAYVSIGYVWVDTGYGAGFIPGRSVAVIDTKTLTTVASIDLGAGGAAWFLQNSAAGVAVAPDRSDVYVTIPRINSVAVIGTSAHVVRQHVPVAGPGALAIVPDPNAVLVPYTIDAVDDTAPFSLPSTGGPALASVLLNDRLGGAAATPAHVTLSQQSSTDGRIALDPLTGAVNVLAGAPLGPHAIEYRICEIADPDNCDAATVRLTVREPYVIDAVNDNATARGGTLALASVLTNDRLGGAVATAGTVRISLVSSTNPGLTLNLANGSISVAPLTAFGTHTLVYRICEIADSLNCDAAAAAITVVPTPLDAVDDVGVSTRSGGVAQGNVLANDKLAGTPASLARVTLEQVSSTHAGVRLAVASGAVTVTAGTPSGVYALAYRICERANTANCDTATVTVSVNPYVINAVNDVARASSKVASTALASVLANDFLGNVRATAANVRLSFISLTPENSRIRLDLTDGSVDVLGKTSSGRYLLVYEICEIETPTNCDRATVTLDLSGGS